MLLGASAISCPQDSGAIGVAKDEAIGRSAIGSVAQRMTGSPTGPSALSEASFSLCWLAGT
jgi:hypothetical protein